MLIEDQNDQIPHTTSVFRQGQQPGIIVIAQPLVATVAGASLEGYVVLTNLLLVPQPYTDL